MILVAAAAIILPLILLGGLNLSATKGMSISAVVVIITGYLFWHLSPAVIGASVLQSLHKALPILWILFGALLMLNSLRATGAGDRGHRPHQPGIPSPLRRHALTDHPRGLPIRRLD